MQQIKGLLYFMTVESKRSLAIFWIILVSTIMLSLMIAYFLGSNNDVKLVFMISIPTYIHCAIYAFVSVKQTIPFSIKMGASRKNIFISMGVFLITLVLIQNIFINLFYEILRFTVQALDISSFQLIHPAQLLGNSFSERLITDFAIMLCLLAVMYVLSLLFYNYGLIGGGSFGAAIVIILVFAVAKGWMAQWVAFISKSMNINFFYWMMLISLAVYVTAWALVRKINIKRIA